MLKRPRGPQGRLLLLEHESRVLRDNPWGDPHVRTLPVWLPPQYDGRTRRRFPVLFDLVGYTGAGPAHVNWRNFDENVPERAARLIHDRKMPPAILVFPDCFTALGGNQYVNSPALGRYGDYLVKELVPFVDGELRTLADRDHRGCFGKSSGGYGAIVHAMRHPDVWGAAADHSGDAYFDFVYRCTWPEVLDELAKFREPKLRAGAWAPPEPGPLDRGEDDGRVRRFLEHVWKQERPTGDEIHCLMMLCMAATYDPDPKAANGFRLPLHLDTGVWFPDRWRRWLRHDPVAMVPRHAQALRALRGLFIDCGWRDQFAIHYGTRQLSMALRAAGVSHHYEEFDDTHSGIDYRMDRSLPFLLRALK